MPFLAGRHGAFVFPREEREGGDEDEKSEGACHLSPAKIHA